MPEIFKTLKIKKEYLIAILLGVLVIIIAFSSYFKEGETKPTTETEKYVTDLERKLEKSIEKIEGVKSVSVCIKVNGGVQTLIAENVKETEENGKIITSSTPVLVNGEPIILGEIYPEIAGVVVVCNCKSGMTVLPQILDLVTTALDVPCDRVRILTQ